MGRYKFAANNRPERRNKILTYYISGTAVVLSPWQNAGDARNHISSSYNLKIIWLAPV